MDREFDTTGRVAQCACGRFRIRVTGEPEQVIACHCDFCMRRTGSYYPATAWFDGDQVIEIEGDFTVYDGLEKNGVAGPMGLVNHYHFCGTCGSTVFLTFENVPEGMTKPEFEERMPHVYAIAVGCFTDPDFPPPTYHAFGDFRPSWLTTHES